MVKNEVLIKAYNKIIANYDRVKKEKNIDKDSHYLKALSTKHIEYINEVFKTSYSLNIKSDNEQYWSYLFARFVYSWSNQGRKSGFRNTYFNDKNFEQGKKIKEVTNNFNFMLLINEIEQSKNTLSDKVYFSNYKYTTNSNLTKEEVVLYLKLVDLDFLTKRNQKQYSESLIKQLAKSILSIAKLLKSLYDDNKDLSKYNYDDIFKAKYVNSIHYLAWALYSDAIKDSGLIDVAKPDVHIVHVLEAIGSSIVEIPNNKIKTDEFYSFMNNWVEVIKTNNLDNEITQYKLDKIIWLTCTGEFYLNNSLTNKQILIKELEDISGN